ncbi:hypothetical protein K7X08_011128 [Anisodus acutangulus]|uniref:Uncharacterized protein n=1 Tax=Anisodus acutangulus TaxID=402998 RepID=A0A9Q1LY59_9SOLA|nr:hypothetical protein K7X08_011128 [Anisodus acutangulus]
MLKFKNFYRECFHLITGLDCYASDFSVVSVRPNILLNRYFSNEERIKLSDFRRFLQFRLSHRASEFWEKYSDVVRLSDVYIVERVLLGHDEGCFVKDHLMKIIDDDVLRLSSPWGTLDFDRLARSLRDCLRSLETMLDCSHCNYVMSDFPYASNRFKNFVVNVVVATDQDMQHFPVALQLAVDASSSSSGTILPSGLIDHLIDDFGSWFDDLDIRFEDLDNRFVGIEVQLAKEKKAKRATYHSTIVVQLVDEIRCGFIDLKTPSSNEGDVNLSIVEASAVDITVLDEISCKHRRCDGGKKDDDDIFLRFFLFCLMNSKGVVDQFTLTESDDESEDEITSLEDRVKFLEKSCHVKLDKILENHKLRRNERIN